VHDSWQTLLVVVDDATKRLLYAHLVADEAGEGTEVVMTALWEVLETHGIPGALYADRARWAVYTPTSGTAPERSKLTQVGRALATLGIEHIVGFSPQARGRSERANGTLQGRLVNELRVAEIRTVAAANRYLRDRFIPDDNARFAHAPADPTSAFVPVGRHDLNQILCHAEARVVARDNTVRLEGVPLQIDKQRGCRSCASLRVLVRRHLDGQHSVWWGPRCLGRYTGDGRLLTPRSRSTDSAAPSAIAPPGANTRLPHKSGPSSAPRLGLSGQITCQTRAVRSLVNNSEPTGALFAADRRQLTDR
jgi:hypothetical protein